MKIFYGKQYIDNKDIKSLISACKSEKITQGKYINKFEKELSKKFKSNYCSLVTNGTAALYLAIKSLNLKKNSKVICSPITFFSCAYVIEMNDLVPSFSDINYDSYNLDIKKLENNLKKDKSIKAVIAVDYAGQPCDWKKLYSLKKKYGIKLINDNCHAIGAKIDGDLGYASKYADIVTHSYHAVKNITTGEGGAILTNNKKIFKKISLLRNHGIERSDKIRKSKGNWFHEVSSYGFNFRITDLQAALGISQLKKLNKFIKKRKKIADFYYKKLKTYSCIKLPKIKNGYDHVYHIFPVLIDFKKIGISKKQFFILMQKKNIFLQTHYIPVYKNKFLKKYKFKNENYPNAEKFYSMQVSLPIFYSLTYFQINYIVKMIVKVLKLN
jgi:dTDP-4-amino-4,6-dideoxygalactose transaminase